MSMGKQEEPQAELALDELFLQIIPDTLRSIRNLIQVNDWVGVSNSLDFLWSVIPPLTSGKMGERPSPELAAEMERAGRNAQLRLDPRESEIEDRIRIQNAQNAEGMKYCFKWTRRLIDQLAEDGYLFEGSKVTPTGLKGVKDQPPNEDISDSAKR